MFSHHHHHFARHRRRHGFAGLGDDTPAGFGRGHRPFWAGRKLGSEDLQLVLLALLEQSPSHGYELIKALEERSGGFYAPSPGMIYPALTYLEEAGYASVTLEGTKKRYQLTEQGRQHLDENRTAAEAMLNALDRANETMERVRGAFTDEKHGDEEFGSNREVLHAAHHTFRRALREKRHCSREEAERIAAILKRAADEIHNG